MMARAAVGYGVPDSIIVLEAASRNTREHPVEALRLPGVKPTTHVAVVTSSWHMRRAGAEFCLYFERIDLYPVALVESNRSIGASDILPQAQWLSENTWRLREWFGIVWYEIRGIGVDAVSECGE